MLVRQDFTIVENMPPKAFMWQILDRLAKVYCFLWDRKDKMNQISMTWTDMSRYYNKNTFKSNLRKLNDEGLLNYQESEDGIAIELVGWDEMSDE